MISTIKSIKKIKTPSKRYDLTIAKNHNFFANGILVHNCSAYSDGHVHARSIDSKGGEDRAWVKSFLVNNVCFNLPEGWRVCGENLWAEHSIHYYDLPSYFMGFSIWNERNVCLSWDDTLDWFQMLDITPVPVLFDGMYEDLVEKKPGSIKLLRDIERSLDFDRDEGYVMRIAGEFNYGQFKSSVAKFVRPGHVSTTVHWRAGSAFKPNELKK
jgi:hypothetical protein